MFTKDVTIYNKVFDSVTRVDKYVRVNISGVHIESTQSMNSSYPTQTDADSCTFIIPINGYGAKWNISKGDLIVDGNVTTDITKQSDLKGYDFYIVKSISVVDYALTDSLNHVEVTC